MANIEHGIGIDGVVSVLGALSRKDSQVSVEQLIEGIRQRFNSTPFNTASALSKALKFGAVVIVFGNVQIVR